MLLWSEGDHSWLQKSSRGAGATVPEAEEGPAHHVGDSRDRLVHLGAEGEVRYHVDPQVPGAVLLLYRAAVWHQVEDVRGSRIGALKTCICCSAS